jgi:hypothetical protein
MVGSSSTGGGEAQETSTAVIIAIVKTLAITVI